MSSSKVLKYNADFIMGTKKIEEISDLELFEEGDINGKVLRDKRDVEFSFEAENEGDDTLLSGEAIMNMFRSRDGTTTIDGSAGYSQRFNSLDGKSIPKINAKINLKIRY